MSKDDTTVTEDTPETKSKVEEATAALKKPATDDVSDNTDPSDVKDPANEKTINDDVDADDDDADDDDAATEGELDTDVWGTTGDETGDSVLHVLQESGISTDDAKSLLYDAVAAGDPTKIDKEALIDKVGKSTANLVMAGVENYVTRQNATIKDTMGIMHAEAGSKENWELIAPWAKKNMDQNELADLSDMVNKGGAQAKFAAKEFTAKYNADTNNTSLSTSTNTALVGDDVPVTTGDPSTRRQYSEALAKWQRTGGSSLELATIQLNRKAGRKAGI